MTSVVAIDPGTEQSAWVTFDGTNVLAHGIESNEALRLRFGRDTWSSDGFAADVLLSVVFESIESYGMAVGREVFETVFWTGRLFQSAHRISTHVERMPRKAVKLHLCESSRAQDTNIRAALLDRFGGKEKAIGRKAAQGPLYGIKSHEFAALAIAVTWWDQNVTHKSKTA